MSDTQTFFRKESRTYFDKRHGIVRIDFATIPTAEDAKRMTDNTSAFIKDNNIVEAPLVLLDVRGCKLSAFIPLRHEYEKDAKSKPAKKAAILANNRLFLILGSFIFNAGGVQESQKNVRMFSSEEAAIQWLQE